MDSHLGHNSGSGTMGQNTVSPDEDGISDESLLDLLRQTSSSDLPGSQTPSATIASHDRRYQHSSASTVPDRKRRLTAPERPARRVVFDSGTDHVPAAVNAPMDVAGQVFTQPIDLTRHDGSPVAEGGGSLLRSGRDEFEINLPGWEPDADVSLCPVCLTEFTFWYRKHHCRY